MRSVWVGEIRVGDYLIVVGGVLVGAEVREVLGRSSDQALAAFDLGDDFRSRLYASPSCVALVASEPVRARDVPPPMLVTHGVPQWCALAVSRRGIAARAATTP